LIAITAISSVNAWSDQVHHLIARIAYDIMKNTKPYSITCADDKLSYLQKKWPKFTEWEDKYPFVESATFVKYNYMPDFV